MFKNSSISKNKKNIGYILIADRGRADVATRLGYLAKMISLKKKIETRVLYENKQKEEVVNIFKLFDIRESIYIGLKIKNISLVLVSIFYTFFTLIQIFLKGFDWFVKNYSINKIKLGDLIYDRYIRKNHNFIKPKIFKKEFVILILLSLYKFFYIQNFFNTRKVNYTLIGSTTYISVSSILLRVSQKRKIPVIYVSGESYRIIKSERNFGDIIQSFLFKKLKNQNQKKLQNDSQKYYEKRINGKLKIAKYDPNIYFKHDEITWKVNNQNNIFLKNIKKIQKKYSHTILYAPHAFAESNHKCGDIVFRDFYQQTVETLSFARDKKNILWLFKIHPYSEKKYQENKISKNLFNKFKSKNIYLIPKKTSNKKLFQLVDLVVSTRGTICLEAATFGKRNLINSNVYYDDGLISERAKNKNEYFKVLSRPKSLKKLNKKIINKAKKILYLKKKYSKENIYNPVISSGRLMKTSEYYNKLKSIIGELSNNSNTYNKLYKEIVEKL